MHGAGLVEHRGRKVVANDWVEQDDEDLVNHWLRAVVGLFNLMESGSARFAVIVQALMTSYVGGRSPVSKVDLLDFHDAWILPPSHIHPDEVGDRLFAPSVEYAIGQVADTGLLVEDRGICDADARRRRVRHRVVAAPGAPRRLTPGDSPGSGLRGLQSQ